VGKTSVFFYKYRNFDIEKTTFTIESKGDSNIFKIETEPDCTNIARYFKKKEMNGFISYI
jgi:hypothetical protein